MFFIDPVYFWYLFIPVMVISAGVPIYVKSTFTRWSQVAQGLFDQTPLDPIPLKRMPNDLGDHFDPNANVVRLVPAVAAMAVAAHELGHVQQFQTGPSLIWIGILFFGLMVIFSILTLPVEIDASRRALNMRNETGIAQTDEDRIGARKVLVAAALTYLAAAIASMLQLLYCITIARRSQT